MAVTAAESVAGASSKPMDAMPTRVTAPSISERPISPARAHKESWTASTIAATPTRRKGRQYATTSGAADQPPVASPCRSVSVRTTCLVTPSWVVVAEMDAPPTTGP